MLRYLVVLAAASCCLVVASSNFPTKTADKDFLLKQQKVYQLLYHVHQPDIILPELYKEGMAWNIEDNYNLYDDVKCVQEFMERYRYGMLPRGQVDSIYYQNILEETKCLFFVFYHAKNFDTFYKTAAWARVHINEGVFTYAFYLAVIHRPDTAYIQLPAPYEMNPYYFFNNEIMEKAHHAKFFGNLEHQGPSGQDTYIILANYSAWYLAREDDYERRLNYFTEDIGLNSYYFYFRQNYPTWLKSEDFSWDRNFRGEEYLYGHKQILTRYYLERLSNDLGTIEDFDWSQEFPIGYYPSLTYNNGLQFPIRPKWTNIPSYKYKYLKEVQDVEHRITSAIDSGFIIDADGKLIKITTPEGLNILGNIIEGNWDSPNPNFYRSIDVLMRKIFGYNLEPASKYQIYPSALEHYSTSLRDPAFYRIYKRIVSYYLRYKNQLTPYVQSEVVFPELKINSASVDKLITYFEYFDALLSNGILVDSAQEAESYNVKARQYRLNHKPFSFHLDINSEKPMKAVVRIFLGPKYNVLGNVLDLSENYYNFYEIDQFNVNLVAGTNKVVRKSSDAFFTAPDTTSSDYFYKNILKGIDGSGSVVYEERLFGFPERLLLPKGKTGGMPFQLFFHVSPVNEEYTYSSRIWGTIPVDRRPFGYPLDRPVHAFQFHGPNMLFKDILIVHKEESDFNVTI
ncbi:arylphorin subunit alpha [Cephus cinctus]|uniref:Arylphorin subunit alpha n=1 Tax=Cephus cinctus TaxID=211228 RepID=A0AAJ7C8L9_CEPCN|nr:arylphorin subunit alpha [Cephus cinctus]